MSPLMTTDRSHFMSFHQAVTSAWTNHRSRAQRVGRRAAPTRSPGSFVGLPCRVGPPGAWERPVRSPRTGPTFSSANDWAPPAMSPRTRPNVLPCRSLRMTGMVWLAGRRSAVVRPCCTHAASRPIARRTFGSRSAARRAAYSRGSRGGPVTGTHPSRVGAAHLVEEVARERRDQVAFRGEHLDRVSTDPTEPDPPDRGQVRRVPAPWPQHAEPRSTAAARGPGGRCGARPAPGAGVCQR